MDSEVDTVIIGSGISGLSLAHFLSKTDKDFIVLESENRVGWIIQTETKNHFICLMFQIYTNTHNYFVLIKIYIQINKSYY